MDILVISNIFNKFSKIFLDNNKSKSDIKKLNEFLEDPFNLNLDHLNKFFVQHNNTIETLHDLVGGNLSNYLNKSGGAKQDCDCSQEGGSAPAPVPATPAANGATAPVPAEAGSSKSNNEGSNNNAEKGANEENDNNTEEPKKKKFSKRMGDAFKNPYAQSLADDDSTNLKKTMRFLIKSIIYPIIFIFLAVFPYIYVTYASFKKLIKSYRNNVRTV